MEQKQIKEYIDEKRQEMMELWETIVNIESGHTQKEGINLVCTKLAAVMEEAGIKTRVVGHEKAGNTLIGEWGDMAGNSPIVFIGHMDTVFEEGTSSEHPFRVENNLAYGPGVLDMKGGLVMAIYIVKALSAVGYKDRPIKLLFAGDEEILHMNSNTKEILADECRGAFAAFNFETGYLDDKIVVGRHGGEIFTIEVKGVAAHSGIAPEKGRNALQEMCYKIIDIQNLNDFEHRALVNMAAISAGEKENIVPDYCVAKGALRYPTEKIYNELRENIQKIVDTPYIDGTSATFTPNTRIDCMEPSQNNYVLFEFVRKLAAETSYGDIQPFVVSGISDSAIPSKLHIPVICGLGPRGDFNHTVNEYADIDSLFDRCVWIATAVSRLNQINFNKEEK